MALDKVIDSALLDAGMQATADAIREKTGSTDPITWDSADGFKTAIAGIQAGGEDEWINDGNTHIWITLTDGRTSPRLCVGVNGVVTVDWGDGTTPNTLEGTNLYTLVETPIHEYTKAGDYIITLTVDGEMRFLQNGGSLILCHGIFSEELNKAYRNAVKKIEIGSSTSIDSCGIQGCYSLASVAIPNSVKNIPYNAFCDCYALTSVVIPNSVTSIDGSAFQSCCTLTSIVIPNSVTSIGNSAFNGCYALTSVVVPESVTNIINYTFNNCYSLVSIVIPNSVTSIGNSVFNNCYSLVSIVIPNSVTSIGSNAFQKCYSLTEVTFNGTPTSIESTSFKSCTNLLTINVPWAEGEVANAPWGATNATINYNYTGG